jgi:hypothetical protein
MRIINPFEDHSFTGAKTYFTSIDVPLYAEAKRKNQVAKYKTDIEREIKVLLLTKNILVTGASAMISEFGYQLFKEHPILLRENMIIPAVGNHVIGVNWQDDIPNTNLVEYYTRKIENPKFDLIESANGFFKDNINNGVGWDLKSNSGNFKRKFIYGLRNEGTVIRSNLGRLNDGDFEKLASFFDDKPENFNREAIEEAIKLVNLNKAESEVVFHFQELIYNMSGASVIGCESSLPQEKMLLDYSIADLEGRKIILSERNIFCKIFFELYFESLLQVSSTPIAALDYVSFEDILSMRREFHDSGFVETYNKVINQIVSSINKHDDDDFLNINELYIIREKIEESYENLFAYARKKALQEKIFDNITQKNINLGLGISSFFDVGTIAGNYHSSPNSLMVDTTSRFSGSRSMQDENTKLFNLKDGLIKSDFLQRLSHSAKSEVIDFANHIYALIGNKLNKNFNYD